MPERRLIVDQLKFSYEGLFNASELYNLISSWFYEKGWDYYEKMNQELITPNGKQIKIVLEPYKNITSYYRIVMQIKIHLTDLKDVDVEVDNETLRLNQGVLRLIINAYLISDRHGLWTTNPFYWLLSIINDKYFFRNHYLKAERWIESDVEDIHQKIKRYMNTFNYRIHA